MPVEKLEEDMTGESNVSGTNKLSAPIPKKLPSFGKLRNSSSKKLNGTNAKSDDPFRFSGNGVDFKCKLIGIQDVPAARGDDMCAEAMKHAKAAVKLAGQHKQRIVLNINLEGIKLLDEKTATCMHQLCVGRISFIARDPSDSRAFGLVYGPPDSQHKFYAIKTQQPATQPVLSIRDMFQIVYDMKKQQIKHVKEDNDTEKENEKVADQNGNMEPQVDTLIDLQSELDHLQQGMEQLDSAANWASFGHEDCNKSLGSTDDLLSSKTNSSFSTTNTSNSGDPFNNMVTSQAHEPWTTHTQRPTFSIDNQTSNGLVNVNPPSQTTPDPFDTSHVRHHLEKNGQYVSTPLPPSAGLSVSQGSPHIGSDWSQAPSSVQASSPNQFNQTSQSSGIFDQSPLFMDSTTNFVGNPMMNQAASESALGDGFSIQTNNSPNVDDVYSKLVGNLDSLIPQQFNNTQMVKNDGPTQRSSTPDPFHHIKNPAKPSINKLRGDDNNIMNNSSQPKNLSNLDDLFGVSNGTGAIEMNGQSANPFAPVTSAPSPVMFAAPVIPPRPGAPPIPSSARPRPAGNAIAPGPTVNPFDSNKMDPFNDDFFK